jgi:hypothetical protein
MFFHQEQEEQGMGVFELPATVRRNMVRRSQGHQGCLLVHVTFMYGPVSAHD